jgi:hypothetical protein
MSSALAIAGVTQVLRDLLNDKLVNQNVVGQLGQSITVSTMPPDKVVQENGVEITQLNLFMRHITPNIGWRNEGLPSRDVAGRNRLTNPPLALNLHYLVSAYGAVDLHAEILLGYAMQMLHETPVIPRESIRRALEPDPDQAGSLPAWLRSLADSGLADQIEQLRITPEYLSTEEMSKFWTSTLAHYRPSAAYEVSVVLIQAREPAVTPLPVLVRSFDIRPALTPIAPTITSFTTSNKQPVVQLGASTTLAGFALDGSQRKVVLTNSQFGLEELLDPAAGSGTAMPFTIPAGDGAKFPVGVYRVAARVRSVTDLITRDSNQVALTIAPEITALPALPVPRVGGVATFNVSFAPELREGQVPRLLLGNNEYPADDFDAPTSTLTFSIPAAVAGQYLVRLRIDGIDSPIIDTMAPSPMFLGKHVVIA